MRTRSIDGFPEASLAGLPWTLPQGRRGSRVSSAISPIPPGNKNAPNRSMGVRRMKAASLPRGKSRYDRVTSWLDGGHLPKEKIDVTQ